MNLKLLWIYEQKYEHLCMHYYESKIIMNEEQKYEHVSWIYYYEFMNKNMNIYPLWSCLSFMHESIIVLWIYSYYEFMNKNINMYHESIIMNLFTIIMNLWAKIWTFMHVLLWI